MVCKLRAQVSTGGDTDGYSGAADRNPNQYQGATDCNADEYSGTANRNANSLVVADYADNIRRIRDLVRQIDRDSAATQIVALDNAGAREIASALQGLAGQGVAGEGARPPVTVVPVDSGNAIDLRGDPSSCSRCAAMAKELDKRAESGAEMRVYQLEYANAETLLPTIQSLIGESSASPLPAAPTAQGSPAKSGEAAAPPAAASARRPRRAPSSLRARGARKCPDGPAGRHSDGHGSTGPRRLGIRAAAQGRFVHFDPR